MSKMVIMNAKTISKLGQKIAVFLIKRVSGYQYALAFIGIILGFALSYSFLTQFGHGIGRGEESAEGSFLQGLYFSVITISSLGYGDFHPMGFSKVLACIEVLLGLGLVGIMIAKITSQRLSHYVGRLFSSDAQQRLDKITKGVVAAKAGFESIMAELPQAYPNNPASLSGDADSAVREDFCSQVTDFAQKCGVVRDYFLEEAPLDDYFESVPKPAFVRVGESIDGALFILSQLIISLSPRARTEILDESNRRMLSRIIESQQEVCSMVIESVQDEFTRRIFEGIERSCKQFPANYFAIPEQPSDQPNQRMPDNSAPQSTQDMKR